MDEVYVSCIKINGRPILPPIISQENREELRSYRDLALQIELKIKDLKSEIKETQEPNPQFEQDDTNQFPFAMSPAPTESTEMNLELDTSSEATMFCSTPGHRLVRSESYTVDTPSQALLDSVAESEISEAPTLTESRPKSAIPKFACGRKKTAKVATILSPKKKRAKHKSGVRQEVGSEETVIEADYMEKLINSMREEYELKLEQLRQQQEEEKMRLKEEFLSQQHELLEKLSIHSSPERPPSPPIKLEKSPTVAVSKSLSELTNRMAQLPLAALVRGYFVRRLHKTARVETIKAQIKETLCLAIAMHEQTQPLSQADITLHGRLIQQLDQSLNELHFTFFEGSLTDRLRYIATDRERMLRGSLSHRSANGRMISSATERRRRSQQENLTPNTERSDKTDESRSSRRAAGGARPILIENSGFDGGNLRQNKQSYVPWR